jgi:hypothetical protein
MTKVRAVDGDNDWLFGKGLNDYYANNDAIAQNVKTRLQSFLGDCFFDIGAGLDWFNFLGSNVTDQTALNLAVSAVILNTENVTALQQLLIGLDVDRNLTIKYKAKTIYSTISGLVNPINSPN